MKDQTEPLAAAPAMFSPEWQAAYAKAIGPAQAKGIEVYRELVACGTKKAVARVRGQQAKDHELARLMEGGAA